MPAIPRSTDAETNAEIVKSAAWARSRFWGLTPDTAMPSRESANAAAPNARTLAGKSPTTTPTSTASSASIVSANDRVNRLAAAMKPLAKGIASSIAESKVMVAIADREGQVLQIFHGQNAVARDLQRRGVESGVVLHERVAGNNGIGTVLELKREVHICGDEHFAESFKDLTCVGLPIVHPLTRRIEGAIDITGFVKDGSRMFAPFVRRLVSDIEANLISTSRSEDRQLWERFTIHARARDEVVCAFSAESVLSSPLAVDVLTSTDVAQLRQLSELVCADPGRTRWTPSRDRVEVPVTLSVGQSMAVIESVGTRSALVRVQLPAELRPNSTTQRGRVGSSVRGHSSSVGATKSRATQLFPTTAAHCAIVGPAGSGRSTAARKTAGEQATTIAVSDYASSAAAWEQGIVPAIAAGAAALVIDDADLLAREEIRRLGAQISRVENTRVVVTIDSAALGRAEIASLVAKFGRIEQLAPVAERGDDVAEYAHRFAEKFVAARGGDAVVLTPRCVAALTKMPLPGGFYSVQTALEPALELAWNEAAPDAAADVSTRSPKPPRRLIVDARHFAPRERPMPNRVKTGGELARTEYDAVCRALEEANGVRAQAARILGVSRTTLYARLREFGLN